MTQAANKDDLASPKDRLREHTALIGEDLQEMGRRTVDAAREKLDRGKEAAVTAYRDGQERVSTYVQAQPLRALGLAAAAGMVLGFLLARRR